LSIKRSFLKSGDLVSVNNDMLPVICWHLFKQAYVDKSDIFTVTNPSISFLGSPDPVATAFGKGETVVIYVNNLIKHS